MIFCGKSSIIICDMQITEIKVSITDKRLLRFIIIGSAISLGAFLLGSVIIWGLNLFIIIGLALGAVIGVSKIQLSARVLAGLFRNEASNKNSTLLNLVFYFLSWIVIILLFFVAYKIALNALIALATGILLIPLVLLVYAVLKGAGLIRMDR